jgi:hypothetical protein
MATEEMRIANLTFHSADISDRRATMILSGNYAFIIPLGVIVNYGDLQFPDRIMVARRSEMSAEWKVRFAISIASVAIKAFTKLLFCFFVYTDDDLRTFTLLFYVVLFLVLY